MATVLAEPDAGKAVTTAGQDMVYFSFPIEKSKDTTTINPVDGTPDIEIWGKVTDGTLDSDLQIVDPQWSMAALKTWFDTKANVRMSHDPKRPIGRGIDLDGHYVKALIGDPTAKHLIRIKALNDWSVGIANPDVRVGDPRFRHLDPMGKAVNGVITGRDDGLSQIAEISACDRGSNYGTSFQIAKSAADGSCEFTGKVLGADLLTKDGRAPRSYRSVSVDLPSTMRIKVSPADLAKMNTMARRNAAPVTAEHGPELVKLTGSASVIPGEDAALVVIKAAEAGIYKRDIDTATRERLRSQGRALDNLSYPIETHEDADNAATLALSGHGNVGAAKKLIRRVARKEGWQDILDRLKGGKKAKTAAPDVVKDDDDRLGQCPSCKGRGFVKKPANMKCEACGGSGRASSKTAEPDVTKCGTCQGTGMSDDKPCPDCPEGKKAAKATAALDAAVTAPMGTPATPGVTKKKKVLCGSCGAMQNAKHVHCPECGTPLSPGAMPVPKVKKNHDFACLGCGKAPLDKGEQYCPDCGRENPGYLPEADRKIPANEDAEKAAKERVSTESVTKGRKGKKAKKGKGKPFGGSQAPPFGRDDDGDADDAKKAVQPKAEKKRKGGKKGGKGRSPLDGVAGGQDTAGLPAHRDGGVQLDPIEADAQVKSADLEQMATAMRYKSLGIPPEMGYLHDLCCPAYHPDGVARAIPYASLADIDTGFWQSKALDAAGSGDAMSAIAAWNQASAVSRAAVMLKAADPEAMRYIALADFAAFRKANKAAMKVFRDATPGPGSFSPPGQPVAAGNFRRPYISAGHGAPSPMHDAPRSFPVPSGGFDAQDFTRDYISGGHASQSPQNDGRSGPVTPGAPGSFSRADAAGIMRDDLRQARATMDDHLSRLFPGVCPVSPQPGPGGTQRPAPGVPGAQGRPLPHAAGQPASKAAKPKAKKAARRKPAKQALKAAQPEVTGPDTAALITEAVKAATAPLVKRAKAQDRLLRRQGRVLNAVAGQPDLSGAPHRGPVAAFKQASPAAPAGPLTAAETAAQSQLWKMQMLREDIRSNPDPAAREASWDELMNMTGLNPMTPTVPAINRPLART